ncbi:MAG: aldo/keto reductase [Patescibacteria group bacterium]
MEVVDNRIILNNQVAMPLLGLGTWKSQPGQVGPAVKYAVLQAGYRHIDCAAIYGNESEIGQTFKEIFNDGLKRDDLFVTSKLWNTKHNPKDVLSACQQTLRDLQLDYLDLYLMHWGVAQADHGDSKPNHSGRPDLQSISLQQTWQAMEELVDKGLVKAIGLANFTGPMILDVLSYARLKPAINQIELHPYNPQHRLVEFCQSNNIAVTAYSPLGSPGNFLNQTESPVLLKDVVVKTIAEAHGKSVAQILIRWAIQRQTVVIPKSVNPDRIKANAEVFDFILSQTEMKEISNLGINYRYVDPWLWWGIPYFD